jgi:hypothetical protein
MVRHYNKLNSWMFLGAWRWVTDDEIRWAMNAFSITHPALPTAHRPHAKQQTVVSAQQIRAKAALKSIFFLSYGAPRRHTSRNPSFWGERHVLGKADFSGAPASKTRIGDWDEQESHGTGGCGSLCGAGVSPRAGE